MRNWILYALAGTALTAILNLLAGVPLGWSALAAFVGWPVAGTMITADDELPGGWSNPDGTVKPDWLTAEYWGQLFAGGAISSLAFAAQAAFAQSPAQYPLLCALVFATTSALMLFRATPRATN